MKRTNTILSVAAAAAMMLAVAPSVVRAESAAPFSGAAGFLNGVNCPDQFSSNACYDPNASGTKYSGTLTVVYDKVEDSKCDLGYSVKNMYAGLTLAQGNLRVPFTTDYLNGPPSHSTGFCLGGNETEQAIVIIGLVRTKAIQFLYSCTNGGCPDFRVKSITNFNYTAGPLSSPTSGGFSADITIAVR